MKKYTNIIVHYDEIGLKGNNRPYFEKQLVKNISKFIDITDKKRERGQIILTLTKNYDPELIINQLSIFPGIASFSFCNKVKLDLDSISKQVVNEFEHLKGKTFKIDTKRHNKNFKLTSPKINEKVGKIIEDKFSLKVKLKNPDISVKVEICETAAFISSRDFKGIGGLPVGSCGKGLCLISGGIDSPVASFFMMKRGIKCVFIHFENKTINTSKVKNKIKDLVARLSFIQGTSKLYLIPFEKIQKEIIMNIPSKYRMVIYRRFMMRISENIALKEKINILITGDSLSQVASQTIQNLQSIYDCVNIPILPPLIGLNKNEIMDIGRNIGTYEISIQPYSDCCSYFIDKHPITKSDVNKIKKIEENLDINNLIKLGVEESLSIKVSHK